MEKMKTGTTIVAIKCKDGIVIGSETQVTFGYLKLYTERKIYELTDNIVAAVSGGVADAQAIVRYAKSMLKLKEIREKEVSVRAATYLISNILFSGSKSYIPYFSAFIIAGFDREGFHIFSIGDIAGSVEEIKDYIANGSGIDFVLSVLDSEYKNDITTKEGIKLMMKCLKVSRKRDIGSGGKADIWVIDKKGIKRLNKKEIEELEKEVEIKAI